MQLIIAVESNSKCKSDAKYISEFIKEYYDTIGIKISFVYLGSKTKYNSKEKDIQTLKNKYGLDKVSKTIFCIDIDCFTDAIANTDNNILNGKIITYVNKNGYDLVWFYRDIEEVFLGRKVPDKDKDKESTRFISSKKVKALNTKKLSSISFSHNLKTSNIMSILDKYLKRK